MQLITLHSAQAAVDCALIPISQDQSLLLHLMFVTLRCCRFVRSTRKKASICADVSILHRMQQCLCEQSPISGQSMGSGSRNTAGADMLKGCNAVPQEMMTAARLQERLLGLDTAGQGLLSKRGSMQLDPSLTMPHTRGLSRLQSQPKDVCYAISSSREDEGTHQQGSSMTQQASTQMADSQQEAWPRTAVQPQSHPIDFQEHHAGFQARQPPTDAGLAAPDSAHISSDAGLTTSDADLYKPAAREAIGPIARLEPDASKSGDVSDKNDVAAQPQSSETPAGLPSSTDQTAASEADAVPTSNVDIGHLVVRQSSMRGDFVRRQSTSSRDVSIAGDSEERPAGAHLASSDPSEQPSAAISKYNLPKTGDRLEAPQSAHPLEDTRPAPVRQEASAMRISEDYESPTQADVHAADRSSAMTSSSQAAVPQPAVPDSAMEVIRNKADPLVAPSAPASSHVDLNMAHHAASLKLSLPQKQLESIEPETSAQQPTRQSAARPAKPNKEQLAESARDAAGKATPAPSPSKPESTRLQLGSDEKAALPATMQHKQSSGGSSNQNISSPDHVSVAAGEMRRGSLQAKPKSSRQAAGRAAAAKEPKVAFSNSTAAEGTEQPFNTMTQEKSASTAAPLTTKTKPTPSASPAAGSLDPKKSLSKGSMPKAVTRDTSAAKAAADVGKEPQPVAGDFQMPGIAAPDEQHPIEEKRPVSILAQEASVSQQAPPSVQRQPSARSPDSATPAPKPPAILRQHSRFSDGPEALSSSLRIRKGDIGSTSGNRVQWKLESDEAGSLSPVHSPETNLSRPASRQGTMLSTSEPSTQQMDVASIPSASQSSDKEVHHGQQPTGEEDHAGQDGPQSGQAKHQDAAQVDQAHRSSGSDPGKSHDQSAAMAPHPAKPASRIADTSSSKRPGSGAHPRPMTNRQPWQQAAPARLGSRASAAAEALQADQKASQLTGRDRPAQVDDSLASGLPAAAAAEQTPTVGKSSTPKAAVTPAALKQAPAKPKAPTSLALPNPRGSMDLTTTTAAAATGHASQGASSSKPTPTATARKPAASMSTIKKMSLADLKAQSKAAARRISSSGDQATASPAQQLPQFPTDAEQLDNPQQQQQQQQQQGLRASSTSSARQSPQPDRTQNNRLEGHAQQSAGTFQLPSPHAVQHEPSTEAPSSGAAADSSPELIKARRPSGTLSHRHSMVDSFEEAAQSLGRLPSGVSLSGRRSSAIAAMRPGSAASSKSSTSQRRFSVMSVAEAKAMAANLKAANEELEKPDLRRRLSLAANGSMPASAAVSEKLTDYQALLADANLLQSMRSSSAMRLSGDQDFSSSWLSGRPAATPKFALSTPGIPARNWHLTLRQYPGKDEPGEEQRAASSPSRSKLGTRRSSMTEIDTI